MADSPVRHADPVLRPADWVDRHGDALFRYALLRVHDREVAEDLVQDCFLAALDACERFDGQCQERTWLVGILKHKIIDHFRRAAREDKCVELTEHERTERLAFNDRGFWKARLARWGRDPHALVENAEFWEVLNRCLGRLPQRLRAAFMLRELEQFSSEEACQVLGLTPTNLWARLHRARLGLRHCLDTHWFGRRSSGRDRGASGDPQE
jgi:RNA polymerase sigma-70 factor (ECF subfamily)